MDTGKTYKASLDRNAKWDITHGIYTILFFALLMSSLAFRNWGYLGLGIYFLILLIGVLVYLTYRVKEYVLYSDKLIIKRFISRFDKAILLSDIQSAERFTADDFYNSKRMNSISRHRYYGDYYNPVFGYYKIYATNLNNLIMLDIKNSKYIVISPDDMGLLEGLQSSVSNK